MDRLLFVVAQERRDLYEALKQALAAERDVDVILDRRVRKRRSRAEPPAAERRRFARRGRVLEDSEIRARGFTVVRLP